jgi:hypothetical protein
VVPPFLGAGFFVNYKGVQYSVAPTAEPGVWRWQFQIGESVKTGKTQTRLAALATRRVQAKIDAALKASAASATDQEGHRPELREL